MSEPSSNPEDDSALLDLAASVSDGAEVDWQAAEAQAGAGRGPVVRALKLIAKIAEVHRSLQRTVILEDGDPARAAGPPVPGRWGHLELLEKVGEGASADVYRARDSRLEREVALKLLHRSPHRGETGNEAVLREGRLLARVRHPNVATVYGADEHDGRVGVWMEFVRGKTLNRLLAEQGPLGAREASLVGIDLCRALASVHEKGVVHRDLKAQNVMREEGGRILLVDFGIGRDLATEEEGAPSLSGTPLYLAPEVFEGRPATLQSDLYSLGVLLFYLVTGKFPVNGASIAELREAHREGRGSLLRDLRPDLPGWYVQAVEKALARDPAARFTSAGQMERALGQMSGTWNRVREAEPTEPGERVKKSRSAEIAWVLALGGLLGIAMVWLATRPPASPKAQAKVELARSEEFYRHSDYVAATAAAERASRLDPTNALVWDRLTTYYSAGDQLEDEVRAATLAHQYADTLDEANKHRVYANGYLTNLNYEQALTEFNHAIRLGLRDPISSRQCAMIERKFGKPSRAVELLEGTCDEPGADWISCGELLLALAENGQPEVALEHIRDLPELPPDEQSNVDWAEGTIWLSMGRLDRAEEVFRRMSQARDVFASEGATFLAQIDVLRGNLREAKRGLEKGFPIDRRSGQVRSAWGRSLALVELSVQLGDLSGAAQFLDKWGELPDRPKAAPLVARRALVEIDLRRWEVVESLRARLNEYQRLADGNSTLAGLAQNLRGRQMLVQEDVAGALPYLEDANRSWPEPQAKESLARAYEAVGRFRDALEVRGDLDALKVQLLNEQLALLWVRNLVYLARDHAHLGENQKAIERYQQFLFHWGQNAADLPIVQQAKDELDNLTSR